MSKINEKLDEVADAISPARRKYLYRLAGAVLMVLVLHKVVTADQVTTYLQALAIALGIVPAEMAARNVPTPGEGE